MVPRRRAAPPRNRMAVAGGVSATLHLAILAALIITFPNKTPEEPPEPTGVQVVFEPGAKTPTATKTADQNTQHARDSAPRGKPSPPPVHTVQAAPPPAPLPRPEIKTPEPPHPLTPPKPVAQPPKPQPPKPAPAAPKPPPPALPKVSLPPPPPAAPAETKAPVPAPAPVPLPSVLTDNTPAEVNLNLPPMPEFAPIPLPEPPPPLPHAPPPPQKAAPARRSGQGRSSVFSQGLMMNGMSFNGGGSGGQAQGLNMQLPRSMQVGGDSDVVLKGDPGSNWLSRLHQWVSDRADYPELAAEMAQQGPVTVRFTVDRTGKVLTLKMVTPTRYALLNEAVMSLFRNATVPPFDPDFKTNTAEVQFTIDFILER